MTQEQKAKAYDKALEIARPYYEEAIKSEKTASIEFLESMFDELRDNDEKIRKEIIDYIKTGTYRKDWITWLENQGKKNPYSGVSFSYNDNTWGMCARDNGVDILFNKKLIEHISGEEQSEQKKSYDTCDSSMMDNKKSPYGEKRDFGYFEEKSDDTVKPKFKVGDWVVTSYGKVNQVIAVDVDEDLDGFTLDDGTYFSGSWKDDYHLWTIKDAKDGDVLFVKNFDNIGGCVFLFNGLDSWKFDAEGDRAVATGYCCASITESGNTDFGIQGPDCVEIKRVHPASKDQRDLLFQKMHEAGYMWDSKSKQLLSLKAEPSGKQKPIDKIQLGKKYKCIASPRYSTFRRGKIYKPVDNFLCNLMNLCYECFEPIEDSEQKPACGDDKKPTDVNHEYFSELLENNDSEDIDDYAYQCAYCMSHDWIKDTATWDDIIKACRLGAEWNERHHKFTWSEEDEKAINDIMWIIEAYRENGFNETHKQMANNAEKWLKSLKQRMGWKPSKEQMHLLHWIANVKLGDSVVEQEVSKYLNGLYEDLKKL